MRQYRAQARALAVKIVNFSAPAEAIVTRNFIWASPKQKGTVK